MEKELITESAKKTEEAGKEFAQKLQGGEVIALYGELGSGKTTFVKGLAKGLGIKETIVSPTFVIIRQLGKLVHIDLYRIEQLENIDQLGLQEFTGNEETVTVIEWPERAERALPRDRINIHLEYLGENKRKIQFGS